MASAEAESTVRSARETETEWRGRLLREELADFDAWGVGLRMADNLFWEELYDWGAAWAEVAS